jgi:hypothetical protein
MTRLLLTFLLLGIAQAQIRLGLKNSTKLELDIHGRLRAAISDLEQSQPFTEDSGNRVRQILSAGPSEARAGSACSENEWRGYMSPIIRHSIEGNQAELNKAYQTLASGVIDKGESLLQRLCLSQRLALQCSGDGRCECLTSDIIEEAQGCSSGIRWEFRTQFLLFYGTLLLVVVTYELNC